ncbi:unnamed protein product [Caenorhabditis auriculariae]|uniref:Uncharacterized protein n=1 Tax=Caenorhabditis auriculariae TaxID=2777116 RepID=A0A8S1HD89_9PELO|nr:unnamed protein product [Caenorhabditis auriculariae]
MLVVGNHGFEITSRPTQGRICHSSQSTDIRIGPWLIDLGRRRRSSVFANYCQIYRCEQFRCTKEAKNLGKQKLQGSARFYSTEIMEPVMITSFPEIQMPSPLPISHLKITLLDAIELHLTKKKYFQDLIMRPEELNVILEGLDGDYYNKYTGMKMDFTTPFIVNPHDLNSQNFYLDGKFKIRVKEVYAGNIFQLQ